MYRRRWRTRTVGSLNGRCGLNFGSHMVLVEASLAQMEAVVRSLGQMLTHLLCNGHCVWVGFCVVTDRNHQHHMRHGRKEVRGKRGKREQPNLRVLAKESAAAFAFKSFLSAYDMLQQDNSLKFPSRSIQALSISLMGAHR